MEKLGDQKAGKIMIKLYDVMMSEETKGLYPTQWLKLFILPMFFTFQFLNIIYHFKKTLYVY